MLLLYAWLSFWSFYFTFGCLFYDDRRALLLPNTIVTTQQLLNTVGANAFFSFLLIPVFNLVPTLIWVPENWLGYILRVILLLWMGDFIFYMSHRLLHQPRFYKYHKMHHSFVKPHIMAGVYAHPLEYLISNFGAMVIPMMLVSSPYPLMCIVETMLVAINILKSHSSNDDYITGSPVHNLHHLKMHCNYGFLYVHDLLFGTYENP